MPKIEMIDVKWRTWHMLITQVDWNAYYNERTIATVLYLGEFGQSARLAKLNAHHQLGWSFDIPVNGILVVGNASQQCYRGISVAYLDYGRLSFKILWLSYTQQHFAY